MTERRLPIGVLAVVPVVIGLALYAFTGQAQIADPAADATATAQAAASLTPAATSDLSAAQTLIADAESNQLTPTPYPTDIPPLATHGAFHDGAWVRVNAGAGDCLNARNSPSLSTEYVIVNICVPDGYEGAISGHTTEAEGHWWWYLAGLGWVAEDYLSYIGEFDPQANVIPADPVDHSKIAFIRGPDVWIMNPDGSEQHRIVDVPDDDPDRGYYAPRPQELTWSPTGAMLSYNIHDYTVPDGPIQLHLITMAGDAVTEQVYAGVAGGGWSPDGARLGIVREADAIQMGAGYLGIPAVLEVATGGQLILGSEPFMQQDAPAFNYDGSLLMVNYSSTTGDTPPAIIIYDADGTEAHRVTFDGDWYGSPAWSPVANLIAMHYQPNDGSGDARYSVYDVDAGAFTAESPTPDYSPRAGGGCGGGDMWDTSWSRDGKRVLYSFMYGDTGANGIWSWDIATGDRSVIPAANAGSASAGAGRNVIFSSSGGTDVHIFRGSTDGGLPQILTQGAQPVWFIGP